MVKEYTTGGQKIEVESLQDAAIELSVMSNIFSYRRAYRLLQEKRIPATYYLASLDRGKKRYYVESSRIVSFIRDIERGLRAGGNKKDLVREALVCQGALLESLT